MPTTLEGQRRIKPQAAGDKNYTFRCYGTQRPDGQWDAICLDLNIRVQGRSKDEVIQKITDAVQSYLETVISSGWQKDLIPRPAPFVEWLPWHAARAGRWIRANRDHLVFLLTGPAPNQLRVA